MKIDLPPVKRFDFDPENREPLPQARGENQIQVPREHNIFISGSFSHQTFIRPLQAYQEAYQALLDCDIIFDATGPRNAQFKEALALVVDRDLLDRSPPKIVASFVGRIEAISASGAAVILVNDATGESQESQCDLEVIYENRLNAGDEFRLEVLRRGSTAMTRILPLAPKPISRENLEEFRKGFEARWKLPS